MIKLQNFSQSVAKVVGRKAKQEHNFLRSKTNIIARDENEVINHFHFYY